MRAFGPASQMNARRNKLATVVASCRRQNLPLLDREVAASEAALPGTTPDRSSRRRTTER